MKNNAFTLAEVLITLSIIGIVAALTIPSFVLNFQKEEYAKRTLKFYSIMSQAFSLARAQYGNELDVNAWGLAYNEEAWWNYINNYILPYLNIASVSKYQIGEDGTKSSSSKFIFADGSYFMLHAGLCLDVNYDSNSYKGPNKVGLDRQYFMICSEGKIRPFTFSLVSKNQIEVPSDYPRSSLIQKCKDNNAFCTYLLMIDGWEFKPDYPL